MADNQKIDAQDNIPTPEKPNWYKRLQQKWGVNGFRLFLILCTFAIGGSLSGRAAHYVLDLMQIDNKIINIITYLVLVTIIWPMSVLLVSILFGQFGFFRKYLAKLGRKMFMRKSNGNNNAQFTVAS